MRVLHFVPTCITAVSRHLEVPLDASGWWVESLIDALRQYAGIELGVVWWSPTLTRDEDFTINGVRYFCLSRGSESNGALGKARKLLGAVIPETGTVERLLAASHAAVTAFRPDLIHVHGTERPYGLIGQEVEVPVVLEIQGILSACLKVFFGQLPFRRRIFLPLSIYKYLLMRQRATYERQVFRAIRFFMGRTTWDRKVVETSKPGGRYFESGEILRPEFQQSAWQLTGIRRHCLYTTTSGLPFKGAHVIIEALARLRRQFPRACLRIGGNIPDRDYGKFLRRLVKDQGLQDAVEFLGWLPASQIAKELERAHVYVISSFIENSPNSLGEAQMVGTPVVATGAGGIPSMVQDGVSGLLFPPGDAVALAQKVRLIFESDELANRLSQEERDLVRERHDEKKVVAAVLKAYQEICQTRHGLNLVLNGGV
jgi:glycosyltransferase involved in cell wall biosynthesis